MAKKKAIRMTAAIRKARVLRLVKILSALPEERFDMCTFGTHTGRHRPERDNYCNTSACAAGWAALDPQLQRVGLVPRWHSDGYGGRELFIRHRDAGDVGAASSTAIALGLTGAESDIFYAYGASRAEIIKRLKKLAAAPFDVSAWREDWGL